MKTKILATMVLMFSAVAVLAYTLAPWEDDSGSLGASDRKWGEVHSTSGTFSYVKLGGVEHDTWPEGGVTNLFDGAGSTGLVTSTSADTNKFLRGDGTWQEGVEGITESTAYTIATNVVLATDRFPVELTAVNGTVTVSRAEGRYQKYTATNAVAIDVGAANTNAVSSVMFLLYAGTNEINWLETNVDYFSTPDAPTNQWYRVIYDWVFDNEKAGGTPL